MTKLGILILASASLFAAGTTQVFTGTITDSKCGAKHQSADAAAEANCVRDCVHAGAQYILAVGDKEYKLSDQKGSAKFAAKKVNVTGVLTEDTSFISVVKIQPAK
jgi:hypothetical protein